jgi:hypothetical protein
VSPIGIRVDVAGTVPQPNFARAITRSHGRVARLGTQAAFNNLLGHYRSGETIRNFRTRRLPEGIEFSDDAPGGFFLETGTKAHLIRPRNAKMLRWFNESGEKVFRKSVRHPGQSADPWLAPAITDNADRFIKIYGDAAEEEWGR